MTINLIVEYTNGNGRMFGL